MWCHLDFKRLLGEDTDLLKFNPFASLNRIALNHSPKFRNKKGSMIPI